MCFSIDPISSILFWANIFAKSIISLTYFIIEIIFVYKKKTNKITICIQIMYTVFLVVHLSDFFDG